MVVHGALLSIEMLSFDDIHVVSLCQAMLKEVTKIVGAQRTLVGSPGRPGDKGDEKLTEN